MSHKEIAELARSQGLPATARLLEKFHTPELFARAFPEDARLSAPAHEEPLNVIGQMVRRGPHPLLLRPIFEWLEKRPLERGLIAWDALARTVIADPALLDELRAAAAPYREVLPAPGHACIDLNAHPVKQLIPGGHESEHLIALFSDTYEHSLEALAELQRRQDPLPQKPGALASLQAMGRLLHLAHLPTLAAVYLNYLAQELGHRPAARDLCEAMFDANAPTRLPADGIQATDLPPELISDWAEYLTYRSYLPLVDPKRLFDLMQRNFANRPPRMPAPSSHLQVVRAHVCALVHEGPPLGVEQLDQICDGNKTWRYAARARVVVIAQVSAPKSPRPLAALHDYITAFGNDLHTVYEALLVGPAEAAWKQEILPMLVREARGLPHEPGVWRAIAMMIGDKLGVLEAAQEMQQRLEQQSRL